MRFTLGKRISLGFSITFIITIFLGAFAYISLEKINGNVDRLLKQQAEFLVVSDHITIEMLQHRRYEKDFFLNIGKPKKQEKYLQKFQKKSAVIKKNFQKLSSLAKDNPQIDDKLKNQISQLSTFFTAYVNGFGQVVSQVKKDDKITPQKANKLMTPHKEAIHELETNIDAAFKKGNSLLKTSALESISLGKTIQYVVLFVVLGCVVALVVLGFWIIRWTRRDVARISSELENGAEQVASASSQVSSSSQSLAQGSSEQASNLEQTTSSMEVMSSMTRQNAENSEQANSLMSEAGQVVTKATSMMKQLRDAMDKISAASDETAKIIKTIDEIAFQTNLLALNAAVEAARAGEAGAGFAVVADEVRNLAMRAAEAAKNTQELIEGNITNIKSGSDMVVNTDEAFDQVTESVKKVSELVSEIAAASREQSLGIDQVNMALNEMDKVTQQNAANAEESAAASEELSAQSETMLNYARELAALAGAGYAKGGRRGIASEGESEYKYLPSPGAAHEEQGGGGGHQANLMS
ncbi:MAG: methyl-accepting chemotaxis protein [Desulfarculaceae bacterium]|jgi:methyl-accepting chemotaxis protein